MTPNFVYTLESHGVLKETRNKRLILKCIQLLSIPFLSFHRTHMSASGATFPRFATLLHLNFRLENTSQCARHHPWHLKTSHYTWFAIGYSRVWLTFSTECSSTLFSKIALLPITNLNAYLSWCPVSNNTIPKQIRNFEFHVKFREGESRSRGITKINLQWKSKSFLGM